MTIENGIVNVKYNRMKKILILLAAAALVAVVSCKKKGPESTPVDTTLPTVTWGIEGDTAEIGTKESTKVTVTAEQGIDELKVEVKVPSLMLAALLNDKAISIQSNYADENTDGILDFVGDSKAASFFKLSSVQDSKEVIFNPISLVTELMNGVKTMKDGDTFTFNIYVKDKVGKDARLVVKFHWTATPDLEWNGGDQSKPCSIAKGTEASEIPADFSVTAPGKIEEFVIKVSAPNSVGALLADNIGVDETSLDGIATVPLDLIANDLLDEYIDKTSLGTNVKDATTLNLNMGKLLNFVARRCSAGDSIKLEFSIKDALGRTEVFLVTYNVTE